MASAIFFSDIHLEDGTSEKTKKFIRFLEVEASQFPKVYILGDLFDVWPKTNSFFLKHYGPVLSALKNLVQQGIEVSYIEGNHDFNLKEAFQALGVKVHTDQLSIVLDHKKIFLTHGDLENPSEKGYRFFRKTVRTSLFNGLLRCIPGAFLYFVSKSASLLSRKLQSSSPKTPAHPEKIKAIYHHSALQYLKKGFDVVVMGHIHLPEIAELNKDGVRGLFINSGDWLKNFTYVVYSDSQFSLKVF